MIINLVGAVGGGNFGDEFILNACISEYSKIKNAKVTISGFDVNFSLSENHQVSKNHINFFKISSELRELFINGQVITIDNIESVFNQFEKIDIIHFIGGGYINSLWPSNYALLAIAYIYARINKIPIYATGLGLYPYIEDTELQTLFNSLSLIDVRDKVSYKFVSNSSYSGDDALLIYEHKDDIIKIDTKPALIISLQSHLFNGEDMIKKIFAEDIFSKLVSKGLKKIIVIEAAPEDNIPFSRDVYNQALNKGISIEFYTGDDLIKNGLPYNEKNFVISSRYHVNLLYSILGLNGLAVYNNEYYKNKHLSIIDMGGKWEVVSDADLIGALASQLSLPCVETKAVDNLKIMA